MNRYEVCLHMPGLVCLSVCRSASLSVGLSAAHVSTAHYNCLMPPVGLQLQANLNMSQHTLDYGLQARQYDTSDFQDGAVKRIMNKLSDIERAGLPAAELEEVGLSRPETQSQSRVVWSCVVQMSLAANDEV